MKHRNNSLRKVFSLIAALGMFASTSGVGLFVPQVAEATGGGGPDKGEIWVCKTLLDAEGALIAGNDNSQKFTIDFTDGPMKPTINFNGPLNYNTDLFDDIDGNDAECQKSQFNNAHAGDYYYDEESIHKNPEMYEAPLYHDGYQGQATLTSQLGVYDTNDDVRDGHIVLNKDDVRVLVVLNQLKEVQNEVPTHANLHATKVVCEDEADLPNWGAGNHANITATTAQDWVDGKPDGACEIVAWDFQWAPSGTANPGDNLGNEASWNTFTGSTTIPEGEFGNDKFVWVREVFHPDYVPFTGVNTVENVSAEVYCGRDGLHYDNYDRVDDLEVGKDYYCVGFNALKDESVTPTQCIADLNLLKNPGFESPVVNHSAGWNIFASGFSGLEWLVEWMTPVNAPQVANAELHAGINGWSSSEGDQYIELDSDYDGPGAPLNGESASTKISQTVDTVVGEMYTLTYDFSPRPGASLADNTLKVWINGDGVASHSADGTGNSDTDWEEYTYSFVATSTTTTIAFSDGGTSNSNGTFLDNTSLTCVPDPVTPEEPKDNFSITGNKTEVRPDSEPENGEDWTIYLLDLADAMETFDVDSTSDTGTDSSSVLTDGEMYLVQVSGDYKFGNANRRADAEYSSELGDWTDAADTHGDKLDLMIDGAYLNWGVYTPTHTYYTFIEGEGTSVNFVIDDTPRTDNEGSLTVNIYELNGLDFEVTDSGGNYSFEDLDPGNYFVFEERRDGWEQIGPDRPTDHCAVSFEEGTGTQTATCDFVNEGEERAGNIDEDEDREEITRTSSGRSGQILGASISVSDDDSSDDDTEGEVMGASTSYPGLPNAGVAPAVELVRTATSLGVGFTLYSLTTRRTTVLRKKTR